MQTKPVLFAATTEAEASHRFYGDMLGFTVVADTPFALVFDADGVTLRVQKVEQVVAVPYTSLGFEVTDLAACVKKLAAKGVTFELFPFLQQDHAGIWTTPDGAQVAWCRDPDGTLLSFSQNP